VELRGEDLVCYSNNIASVGLRKRQWSLTYQQSVFKQYHSNKHIYEFYPQDGGEKQLAQIWNEITSLSPYVDRMSIQQYWILANFINLPFDFHIYIIITYIPLSHVLIR